MSTRLNYTDVVPEARQVLLQLEACVRKSGLDDKLIELTYLRASQLNGCAFCVDMHARELRQKGESEQRVHAVVAWRDTPFFSARERSALALTEAVTRLGPEGIPDAVYEAARNEFDERELAYLTLAVATINVWNRLSITFRRQPALRPVQQG
jgi:AhpD family alkylhydroperoxidase